MNLHNAGITHLLWKKYLKDFVDGKGHVMIKNLMPCQECELGKWLASGVIEQRADIAELRQLEKVHKEYHQAMDNIINYKKFGKDIAAQGEYENLEKKSKELIGLLTALTMNVELP